MLYSPAFRFPSRKPTGAKLALKPFHVWGIRVRLQVGQQSRDLALFDLALDSKLTRLRPRSAEGFGSGVCKRREAPRDDPPTEDGAPGSIRGDGAGAAIDRGLGG